MRKLFAVALLSVAIAPGLYAADGTQTGLGGLGLLMVMFIFGGTEAKNVSNHASSLVTKFKVTEFGPSASPNFLVKYGETEIVLTEEELKLAFGISADDLKAARNGRVRISKRS